MLNSVLACYLRAGHERDTAKAERGDFDIPRRPFCAGCASEVDRRGDDNAEGARKYWSEAQAEGEERSTAPANENPARARESRAGGLTVYLPCGRLEQLAAETC